MSGALAKLRSEKMPLVPVMMQLLPVSGALAKLRSEKMPLMSVVLPPMLGLKPQLSPVGLAFLAGCLVLAWYPPVRLG